MVMWWENDEEERGRRFFSVLEAGDKMKESQEKSVTSEKTFSR